MHYDAFAFRERDHELTSTGWMTLGRLDIVFGQGEQARSPCPESHEGTYPGARRR